MTILLRDVIDIPERAGAEDYVLRLTEASRRRRAGTPSTTTWSPRARRRLRTALGLVADALTTGISRGRVPHRLLRLRQEPLHGCAPRPAAPRPDGPRPSASCRTIVARHDAVLSGRKILPLAFHLLGRPSRWSRHSSTATSGRSRPLHPGRAPAGAVHQSDALLDDAERLRLQTRRRARSSQGLGGEAADDEVDAWAGLLGAGAWDLDRYDAGPRRRPCRASSAQ